MAKTKRDFDKLNNRDLVRTQLQSLTRTELDIFFRVVDERRRKLKVEMSEFDDVMRNISVSMNRG